MHVLIWGAGAIGGTIGAYRSRAGHQVILVDRDKAHVEMMPTRGVQITGPVEAFSVPVTASTPEAIRGQYETVLLCVKAQDTEAAARSLLPHLRPQGYVVSVQNGLHELVIETIVGRARTVGACVNFGVNYHAPGVVLFGGRGAVVLGELDGAITPSS